MRERHASFGDAGNVVTHEKALRILGVAGGAASGPRIEENMYRKIICAIEMGAMERAERVLRRASALVDDDGDIVLLHVVEDVPSYLVVNLPQDYVNKAIRDAEEVLTALSRRMAIPALVAVRAGVPATGILDTAKEHHADLIILASHIPNLSNYFIGATADRVVRHAKCSVLVDRRPHEPTK
jgi:universal stress protein F